MTRDDAVDTWLRTARPLAVGGKFVWTTADSFSAPCGHEIPIEIVWSPALRLGDRGLSFASVYDTEQAAITALRDLVRRYREAEKEGHE